MVAIDILTLDEAKAAVDVVPGDSRFDVELPAYITAVSELLDDEFGPVVARALTELHDGSALSYAAGPGARRGTADLPSGGRSVIFTSLRPAYSFTTVTEYDVSGNPTVLTAETVSSKPTSSYLAEPDPRDPTRFSGKLTRRGAGVTSWWAYGEKNISVLYSAGRYATTDAVSGKWKTAAKICLQNAWRSRQQSVTQVDEFDVPQANFPKFGLPNAARDLLRREKIFTGSIG